MRLAYWRKIGTRLGCGFGILVLLMIFLSTIAVIQLHHMADIASELYNHPLAVSKSVRDIKTALAAMDRSLKDVVLAESDEQLLAAYESIDEHERIALDAFAVISERFLGDMADVEAAREAFIRWHTIRQDVIELRLLGDIEDASALTRGRGAAHVAFVNEQIQRMSDFADEKADSFFSRARDSGRRHIIIMFGSILLIIAASVTMGLLITRSITEPIKHIIGEIDKAASGDLGTKINLESNDEMGQLARAFDRMTENLRKTTASRDELDAANQRLQSEITERRKSQEALALAKKEAEAANEAKSRFLANMSHEIRTPMNAVIGFSDILDEEGLTARQQDYVDVIRNSARHLLEVINDVLDFSKIEAGKLDVEIKECSLRYVLSVIESMAYPLMRGKDLEFEIRDDGRLPAMICTDQARLQQCLMNLVSNAIKFTKEGHVHVNVSLEFSRGRPHVRFDVEDTGIGIASDRQQAIFESFTQAEGSTSRKYGGTGLGLTITKQLVGLLGGELSLASEKDKGSVFSLMIPAGLDVTQQPLLDRHNTALDADLSVEKAVQREICGHVLVAEDVETNVALVRSLLNRAGLDVTIARDGSEAVEKALAGQFDLILMDIQMPNMNGYEATTTLRNKGIKTPIIALTANAMKGDQKRCIEVGCDDYLSKPIDRRQLLEKLRKYLRVGVSA